MKGKTIDLSSILGLAGGMFCLLFSIFLEFTHSNPDWGSSFLQLSALVLVFGGTFFATMASSSQEIISRIPQLVMIALSKSRFDANAFVSRMLKLAEAARREGILQLEQEIPEIEKTDWFLAMGLRLIVDGTEPQMVEDMLTSEVETMAERHKEGAALFAMFGGNAPAMGIAGTVVGLIAALGAAGESGGDPSAMMSAIATAFITTFYGIVLANICFLPVSNKLKQKNEEEVFIKRVQIEALKAIQGGENPRVVHAKLAILFKRGVITPINK